MARRPMSRGESKRVFRKASGTKAINVKPRPRRGGIRL